MEKGKEWESTSRFSMFLAQSAETYAYFTIIPTQKSQTIISNITKLIPGFNIAFLKVGQSAFRRKSQKLRKLGHQGRVIEQRILMENFSA